MALYKMSDLEYAILAKSKINASNSGLPRKLGFDVKLYLF